MTDPDSSAPWCAVISNYGNLYVQYLKYKHSKVNMPTLYRIERNSGEKSKCGKNLLTKRPALGADSGRINIYITI